jgi:hypothetical protein
MVFVPAAWQCQPTYHLLYAGHFFSSTTVRCGLWLPIQFSSIPDGPSIRLEFQLYRLLNKFVFTGLGCQPNAQPPAWRTRVSLLVWNLTLDLSGFGDPASSYATASIALEIIGACNPHCHDKGKTPLGGLCWTL